MGYAPMSPFEAYTDAVLGRMARRAWVVLAALAALMQACVGDPAGLASGGCPQGSSACGDLCVDLQLDRNHCGSCDAACPAEQVCSLGGCGLECFGGSELCGEIGRASCRERVWRGVGAGGRVEARGAAALGR